jgi:putative ABC transport system permease protein
LNGRNKKTEKKQKGSALFCSEFYGGKMKKAYVKDIVKEIKRTRKRYISIIAIVILGVAFFVGINASCPDMLNTFNKYINDYNVFDLNLISTVGFDNDDVGTIRNIDKIDYIQPVKSICAVVEQGDKEKVLSVSSAPDNVTKNTMNKVEIVEGEYPKQSNEIVLDSKLKTDYKIGDTIEFIDTENQELEDVFKVKSYTVVGFANSPLYVAISRGSTTLVDGTISGFAIVLEDAFSMEEYTNIYAKVTTNNKNRTSDEYIEEIKKIRDEVKEKTDVLADTKYKDLYEEANNKIDDAKKEVQDAKNELKNAEQEIANGKTKLEDSQKELNTQKQNFNNKMREYDNQIKSAKTTLDSTKSTLDQKQKELNDAEAQLNAEEQKLILAEQKALEGTGLTDLNKYLEYLQSVSAPQEAITSIQTLIQGKAKLEQEKSTLQGYKNELNSGLEEYNKGLKNFENQKQTLENTKKTTQAKLDSAQTKIDNGRKELKQNEDKFNDKKEEANKKIADAEKEIKDAEKKLEDLKVKIYVLDLETNEGYVSYKSDSNSVATIGKVFPIIFFLVAALVSLTAMTRMVEEDRGIIGTYKSLGYSRPKIALKYLTYSTSATLLGIVLGAVIGSYTLPWVISEAYKILYHTMPTVIMEVNMKYTLIAGIAAFASTTIATMFACYRMLRATPAKLMRPKSPKEGKKILLERIPFIWKHLNFTQKITARNVFRYKKRLFMTLIGIAGCTALIFMGFGLRNSIATIVSKQYGQIRRYDFEITLKNELTEEGKQELNKYIEKNGHNSKYTYLRQQTNDVTANGEEQNVYIIGVENQDELMDFVTMQDRKTKEKVKIQNDGVVITEKLSKLLNAHIGDEITIKIDDEKSKNVKVSGIIENYVYHYIYMDKAMYEDVFDEEMIDNHIYLDIDEALDKQTEEEISKYLLKNENIAQVLRLSSISESFSDMIKSLDTVVIVLITCAGMLAFVVLYNLNSINIEERKRELATIKLLGFYNNELSNYVFRENVILTIIGGLLGLVLGLYLLTFIISTAEMDIVMFGRERAFSSYFFAFTLTLVFAFLINLIMNKELRKINMIESLKSVE